MRAAPRTTGASIHDAFAIASSRMQGAVAVRRYGARCQIGVYVGREFQVRCEGDTWDEAIGHLLASG